MTLIEPFPIVEETRSDINGKHDLVDVIFLVISAIMSGPKAGGHRDLWQLKDQGKSMKGRMA